MMELINKDTTIHANLMLVHDLLWPNGDVKEPTIWVYYSWPQNGHGEEAWVRYAREDGTTYTFWFNKKLVDTLIKSPLLCMDKRIVEELQHLKQAKHEFPKEWLTPAATHSMDSFTQGDLWNIDNNVAKLSHRIGAQIKRIKELSKRLRPLTVSRVYDLYISFNVNPNDLTKFRLRFDRIYPKLPERTGNGDELEPIIIGIQEEFGLEKNDNPTWNKVVSDLKSAEHLINKHIASHITSSGLKDAPLEYFKKDITSILMATSHFTDKVFGFDGEHGKDQLIEVANDIINKLLAHKAKGFDIRLDISSWFAWIYPEDGSQPIRADEPELQFYMTIMESYTESFVDQLGAMLMNSPHVDVIRPYQFHVKADPNDGRAIGSMQRIVRKEA